MEMMKRTVSAFLAMVMVFGMVPVSAWATESEVPEAVIVEETTQPVTEAAVETTLAQTEPVETEPAQTDPVETTVETEPQQTEAETEPVLVEEPEFASAEAADEEIPFETVYAEPDYGPDYWLLEEETVTRTEAITVVEQNEDGTYRMQDTTETYTETYFTQIPVSGAPIQTYAITKESYGYLFDSFEDLQKLAEGTYNSWTAAYYTGSYPFVIEESITLPANLNLRFKIDGVTNNDDASLYIPAGVTFANSRNGSIRVGHLEVAGTFEVNETLNVIQRLTVTGQLRLTGNTLLLQQGATLSGADKVIVDGGWGPFWHSGTTNNLEEIKSFVTAANRDTSGWTYLLNISGYYTGEITLTETLSIPDNMQVDFEGSGTTSAKFIIGDGGKLVLNMTWGESDIPIVVQSGGVLENNCREFYVFKSSAPITVEEGGSYTGTGKLLIMDLDSVLTDWSEMLVGVAEEEVSVSGSTIPNVKWAVQLAANLSRLDAPTDVQWGKRVVNSYDSARILDAPGHSFWRMGENHEDAVVVRYYNADTDELLETFQWGFGGHSTNARSIPGFIELNLESGRYYFTVTSIPRGNTSAYTESVAVKSDVYEYVRPDAVMEACTDVRWEWPLATWQDPETVGEHTQHMIQWYYSEDGTGWTGFGRDFGACGQQTQFWEFNWKGEGYYAFQVLAIPDNAEEYTLGQWSEMSEPYYYDPDAVTLTEAYLQELVGSGETYLRLDQAVTVEASFDLPGGMMMEIADGGSITVANGAELNIYGTLRVGSGGKLELHSGGILNLTGSIHAFRNAQVLLRGSVNYADEWTYVDLFWADGAVMEATVTGVPAERINLNMEHYPANDWNTTVSALEQYSGEYGRVILCFFGDVTMESDLTIPANAIVHVQTYWQNGSAQDSCLTIPEDKTVTNYGEFYVQQGSSLVNSGTINTYRGLWSWGTVQNRGTVNVHTNLPGTYESMLSVLSNGLFRNDGTVNIYPDAYQYVDAAGRWEGNAPNYVREVTGHDDLADWLNSLESGSIAVLASDVTLERNLTVPENIYLNIQNATLTVPEGMTLTMNGSIRVLEGGCLNVDGKININTGLYVRHGGTLDISGGYAFGTNALGVSGDIHCYYGESYTVNGVADTDYITDFVVNGSESDADVLRAFENSENRSFLQVYNSVTLDSYFLIPTNGEVHVWGDLNISEDSSILCYGNIYTYDMAGDSAAKLNNYGSLFMEPGTRMVTYGTVNNQNEIYFLQNAVLERNNTDVAKWLGNAPIFLGGGSNDPQYAMTQAELEVQINALKKTGGTLELSKAVVLEKGLTIPENVCLSILPSGSLYVPEGVSLTLNSRVNLFGGGIWTAEGSTLNVGDIVHLWQDGKLYARGDVTFQDHWSLVAKHHEQGWAYCELAGIPEEKLGLYVYLTQNNEDCWSSAISLVNNNASDYPRIFLCVDGGDVTLSQDLTIAENVILHIENGASLIVENGYTIENHGQIYVWQNCALVNNGTIENHNGIYVYGSVTQDGTGTVTLEPGSVLECDGIWTGSEPVSHGGTDNVRTVMTAAELQEKVNTMDSVYQLDGSVVVLEKDLTVKGQLRILNDSTVIVPAGRTLTVYGGGAIYLWEGADLIVEEGGKLVIKNGDTNGYAGAIYTNTTREAGGILKLDGEVEGYWGCVSARIDADRMDGYKTVSIEGFPAWLVVADMRLNEFYQGNHTDEDMVRWAMEELANPDVCDMAKLFGQVKVFTDDLVLNSNLTIPSNAMLLIIPTRDNINNGDDSYWAQINSTVEVYGVLQPQPYGNGTPCNLRVTGEINIHDGGALRNMAHLDNQGTITCFVGGNVSHNNYYGGTWTGYDPVFDTGMEQSLLEKNLADGEYTLKEGIILERDLTLTGELTIGEGGHIIVPEGVTLSVNDGGGLFLYNGGKLTVYGTLANNGSIELHGSSSALACWGVYTAGENAELRRYDFDLDTADFVGAIDGIDRKDQCVWIDLNYEDQLHTALALAEWGWGSVAICINYAIDLTEELYIPANASVTFDGHVTNCTAITVAGHAEFPAYVDNSADGASITVKTGGSLSVSSDCYTGKEPVLEKGARVEPYVQELRICYGEPELTVSVVEAAQGCLVIQAQGYGDTDPLKFVTWTSGNKKVIDPANIVYNGDGTYSVTYSRPGTATLTATSLASTDASGSCLSTSIKVTVTAVKAETLQAEVIVPEDGVEVVENTVTLLRDKAEQAFLVDPAATVEGSNIPLGSKDIQWTVSEKSLATVTTQADGTAQVTVKANAYGEFDLTGKLLDGSGLSVTYRIVVQDISPRLGSLKLSLNPLLIGGTQVKLTESYGNNIDKVAIEDDRLSASYDDATDSLVLRSVSEGVLKNGTVKTVLNVTCENGETYSYSLTVTVKSATPAITVKQAQKLDLFYTDSVADLSITAKDAVITAVELSDTYDFLLEDLGNGYRLCFSENLIQSMRSNAKYKPDTKATLRLYLEGYAHPVEKAVTISTVTSKLTLVTDPGSSVVNTALNTSPYRISFQILDKKAKMPLGLEPGDVDCEGATVSDSTVLVNLGYHTKNRTLTFYVQQENWMRSVKMTHKVSFSTKAPTVKLGASTLTLYGPYPQQLAETTAVLSQGNLEIDDIAVSFKDGDAAKILVSYENGKLIASLYPGITPENGPKPGTYTYTVTPYVRTNLDEVVALKSVTLKVKMVGSSGLPKAKLGSTSVKLNTALVDKETAKIPVTFKDTTGIGLSIVGFSGGDDDVNISYENGYLLVSLKSDTVFKKTYTLYPIAADPTGDSGSVPAVKLTVQSYATTKPITVTQSAKGKLDTLNGTSAITYTIGKITNALGPVDSVKLSGDDADKFYVSCITTDAKGKQSFQLKLSRLDGYSTRETYSVRFVYSVCGQEVTSAPVKVKVTQSAVKITAAAGTYYLSQSTAPCRIDLTVSPATAYLSGNYSINRAKSSADLVDSLRALEHYHDADNIYIDGLNLYIRNDHKLKAGKTYKLVLDLELSGGAENINHSVTITVKVAK